MKQIVLLGSTGSIGRQTLDVVARHRDRFQVVGLVAGRNAPLLAEQVRVFRPHHVVVAAEATLAVLCQRLGHDADGVQCGAGIDEITALAQLPAADIVVAALVGAIGLAPTYAALAAGKRVALANKETMVVAGALMRACATRHGAEIVPVDSEHCAVFQALSGQRVPDVSRVILTASGGPFRDRALETFGTITVAEALRHPNWDMGAKVTIDSATMMNKGLELIEARWLFDLHAARIEAVIHPQSIVHALVEFCDGTMLAQLAVPDMRAPIAYALGLPERIASGIARLDLVRTGALTFSTPDPHRYPCLQLARTALEEGKSLPAVLNAANEVAVGAFLDGKMAFVDIARLVEATLATHRGQSIDDIPTALAVDQEARARAVELIPTMKGV